MFRTQKEEEIDNYTDYSDADPFLSLPIRNEKCGETGYLRNAG